MAGSNKSNNAPRMYFPKALVPGYMGQFIPVKHAQEILRDGLGVKHYYSETLSMSSSDGGSQKAPYSPKPDIVAANNIVNIREMLRPPKFFLSQVDSSRREDIDNFYKLCQMHRDQYKDYSGRLHPLDYFKTAEYKWQCPPELTRTYKRYPQYYVKYVTPTVLDGTQARTVQIPDLPERSLVGRYYRHSDTIYKK